MRFNIVMADEDAEYTERLCRYIRITYPSKFNIAVYTEPTGLGSYLAEHGEQTDILLVSSSMLPYLTQELSRGTRIILSGERLVEWDKGKPAIYKYQTGDKIINEMIRICSSSNPQIEALIQGDSRTQMITVFSPQGGSGTTTLSMFLASGLACQDKAVLFLTFERVQALSRGKLQRDSGINLSNVIFHLKQKEKGILALMNSALEFNPEWKISCFIPADCDLDIDDMSQSDMEELLAGLRMLNKFDYVVIDGGSILNYRSMAAMDESEHIVLVSCPDPVSRVKLNIFLQQLKTIKGEEQRALIEKCVCVANRQETASGEEMDNSLPIPVYMRIPALGDVAVRDGISWLHNPDSSLNGYITDMVKLFTGSGRYEG